MLMRLDIFDFKSGVCLFEKIWKWSGVSHPEGVCNLVASFYKISRDIGGEETTVMTHALFESASDSNILARDRAFSLGKKYMGSYKNSDRQKKQKESQPPIRLISQRNQDIAVAIFHEVGDDLSLTENFVAEVLDSFSQQFQEKMEEMKPTLSLLADENASPEITVYEVMQSFSSFESALDSLEKKLSENLNTTNRGSTPSST